MQPDEITIRDAADILRVHYVTAFKWCKLGRIKTRRRGKRRVPLLASVLAWRDRTRRIARLKASAP